MLSSMIKLMLELMLELMLKLSPSSHTQVGAQAGTMLVQKLVLDFVVKLKVEDDRNSACVVSDRVLDEQSEKFMHSLLENPRQI